jgi:threonine dehydrogenase-like Zn-dependent dehydrogenase
MPMASECVGVAAAAGQSIGLTRKGGTFIQVGLFGKAVELPFEEIPLKELTVVGSFAQKKTSWNLGKGLNISFILSDKIQGGGKSNEPDEQDLYRDRGSPGFGKGDCP